MVVPDIYFFVHDRAHDSGAIRYRTHSRVLGLTAPRHFFHCTADGELSDEPISRSDMMRVLGNRRSRQKKRQRGLERQCTLLPTHRRVFSSVTAPLRPKIPLSS